MLFWIILISSVFAGTYVGSCDQGFEPSNNVCMNKCPPRTKPYLQVYCRTHCVEGFINMGFNCLRRNVQATNHCPWYDKCGLVNKCTSCPEGYKNNGCTCRPTKDISYGISSNIRVARDPRCKGNDTLKDGLCHEAKTCIEPKKICKRQKK